MTHTVKDKEKLVSRIRRIRGQLNGIERALLEEKGCFSILQTSTACRGALNSLITEILEGHIRSHLLEGARNKTERDQAAHELIDVVKAFLK
jgi:FrmR/RcnR family transcriptional regulator, repressor of rcnA expression